tara:strand:+ start:918 stop:1655 length:738 start_codon:yes stop_codon:yes gene_type:complete
MTIDYKQLETLVREAMFTGGGINEPSAPGGVPHRMPAAEPRDKEQDMGEEEPNEKYDIALAAREATEQLVEALDEPIYDGAYEHAFKASACLRKALNSLIEAGAHPMPIQRVVAPDPGEQMYSAGGSNAGDYSGGMGGFAMSMGDGAGGMMEAQEDAVTTAGLGTGVVSGTTRAKDLAMQSKSIAAAGSDDAIKPGEHKMLGHIQKILTKIAKEDDLILYRSALETSLKQLLAVSSRKSQQGKKS